LPKGNLSEVISHLFDLSKLDTLISETKLDQN
jgi:hypothetical protein